MKDINNIQDEAVALIEASESERDLIECAKPKIFGKNGTLTEMLRSLKEVAADKKPALGKAINDLRVALESKFETRRKALHDKELERSLMSESVDITIDKPTRELGSLHIITQVRQHIIDYFVAAGYTVYDSPEIETDYYNFQALNVPKDHPARDMQDTFFITDSILLRSQTSGGQIRMMEQQKPPIKMICPGRTYRSDDDATHSPVFHQIEGLVVDKDVTLCDLTGVLSDFAKFFFGKDTKTRFRPSYFPFTEPSVEVDVSCPFCKGKGCRVCKTTGWIEILGSGMVNRKVLENCNVDPDVYRGFAFGMGLDRITMITNGINDLKNMWENDVRFLRRYK